MYDFQQARPLCISSVMDVIGALGVGATFVGDESTISGFCTDSRQVAPGSVFVAIPGARVDGHAFVGEARRRGAVAFLVSSLAQVDDPEGCILVEDTVNALGFLAACHRLAMPTRIVGLTGSVGKTTTKEILYSLMCAGHKTIKSEGNFNSTIGLPMQLLRLTADDAWMIAEMGMSTPGEIALLARMARPDVGLLLNVQAVHLANFESLEEIARAKAELADHLGAGNVLVYNLDNPHTRLMGARFQGPKLSFSLFNPDADVTARIEPFPDWSGTDFELRLADGSLIPLKLPLAGRFNVANAVAAAAAALACGVPAGDLRYALAGVNPIPGRSRLTRFAGDRLLVDDSYNANPFALGHVLRAFAPLAEDNYRWLILGDMLELGETEVAIHRDVGYMLGQYGFDRVTLVGSLCRHAYEAMSATAKCRLEHFPSAEAAAAELDLETPRHARIWCKASRGVHLERVVSLLERHLGPEAPPEAS